MYAVVICFQVFAIACKSLVGSSMVKTTSKECQSHVSACYAHQDTPEPISIANTISVSVKSPSLAMLIGIKLRDGQILVAIRRSS
jgi:hypothetical protein